MKTIGGSLLAHIQSSETTLALCVKITRKDTTVIGFTSHTEDLTISSQLYNADIGSYSSSNIRTTSDLSVDNLDLEIILDSIAFTEQDLIAGKYDYAKIEFFLVNYLDLTQGTLTLMSGVIGDVTTEGARFKAELRSLMQYLQQAVGRVYGKRCDTDLGSTRCGVNLATYTVTGTVSSFTNNRTFVASTPPARFGGKLTWTSGLNVGISMEVAGLSGSTITLDLPMPYNIANGDAYSVSAGCDKLLSTCRDTYSNVINYQGFPFIPGPDSALAYPDAK